MPFLSFQPLYQERVWGGRALAEWLGRDLPAGAPIGESWEVVDRPEAQSVVAGGRLAGLTLRQVLERHPADVMGPTWESGRPFPILVKWLDCRERLSLQVHPPAAVAPALCGEPKTENWFVAHATAGAAVLAGLKPGVDAARFRAALAAGSAEQLVIRHETRPGDSILIHSGVMHAIDGGNVILEIQQNSDTTYRVYDWGRVGLDGRARQLHVEQSLACLTANTAGEPQLVRAGAQDAVLADCREFRIRQVVLAPGQAIPFAGQEQPRLLSVVEGELCGADGAVVPRGATVLLPFNEAFAFQARDGATVLVTENFTDAGAA